MNERCEQQLTNLIDEGKGDLPEAVTYQLRIVPKKHHRTNKKHGGRHTADVHRAASLWDRVLTAHRPLHILPRRVIAGLKAISSPRLYPKGSILFVEGQKPSGVFLVCRGRLELSASSADGKSLIVRRVDAGEVVGLPATISGRPYRLTAEVLEPLQCDFIPRGAFRKFLREHTEAAWSVAVIVTDMYQAAVNQVRYLGLSASTTEKLARFLLDLRPIQAGSDGSLHASLPLTHKEIAEMIGSSRETVTRIFARFKRLHLVKVRGTQLVITNKPGLEELLVA